MGGIVQASTAQAPESAGLGGQKTLLQLVRRDADSTLLARRDGIPIGEPFRGGHDLPLGADQRRFGAAVPGGLLRDVHHLVKSRWRRTGTR